MSELLLLLLLLLSSPFSFSLLLLLLLLQQQERKRQQERKQRSTKLTRWINGHRPSLCPLHGVRDEAEATTAFLT